MEPYEGADADARAIDTRLGTPSARAVTLDRALRGRPRDDGLRGLIVRYLAEGATDRTLLGEIEHAAGALARFEAESRRLSAAYRVEGDFAVCDATRREGTYDKTMLLLIGQQKAPISVVHDESTVTVAARFDSGIDLVALLGLDGGMPTRVSVAAKKLPEVLDALRAR